MKTIIISILCLLSISVYAQKQIDLEDVKNHVGDTVKIMGMVYGGKYLENAKGSPTFLNIGAVYPNALLTVVIWKNVRDQFKGAPEELWNKHKVFIIGKIEMYKDKPQIVLSNANNIVQVVAPPIQD